MKLGKRMAALVWVLLLGAALIGIVFWIDRTNNSGSSPNPTPTPGTNVLCERKTRDFVDFSVLNDVYQIVKAKSAFRDTASDPGFLLRGTLVNLFGFLSVPEEEIPVWAYELVDAQIKTGKIDFSVLNDVYNRLRTDSRYQDLNDPQRSEDLMITAINGLLRTLGDPFAHYQDAQDYRLNKSDLEGTYRGYGFTHRREGGYIVIQSVFPGQPAAEGGLRYGDKILAVNGKSTEGCSPMEFSEKVRSSNGRAIFHVEHLDGRVEDIELHASQIAVSKVHSCPGVDLDGNRGRSDRDLNLDCPLKDGNGDEVTDILYIKFEEFSDQAFKDFILILESVDLTQYRGITIDLRGNPGGFVYVAEGMLDIFLDDETLYRRKIPVRDNEWDIRVFRQNRNRGRFTDLPIAILVDKNSASASEKFSASMKDNGRAVIVGERTYGKGARNAPFELRRGEYGALVIVIEFFLSPNGDEIEFEDLNHNGHRDANEPGGVTPTHEVIWTDEDFRIRDTQNSNWDPVLFRAFGYLKTGK